MLAENLDVPWAIDIAGDGRLFFTERPGRIRVIDNDGMLLPDPVGYINVEQHGESGLLGLALHPNFTENHLLYVYHTYSNGSAVFNQVLMLTEKDNKIVESKIIIDKIPALTEMTAAGSSLGPMANCILPQVTRASLKAGTRRRSTGREDPATQPRRQHP